MRPFDTELMALIAKHHPDALKADPRACADAMIPMAICIGGMLAIVRYKVSAAAYEMAARSVISRIVGEQKAIEDKAADIVAPDRHGATKQ